MHCVMEVCTTQNRQFGCAVGHGPVCAEGQRTSGKSGCSKTVAASRSGSTVTSFSSSLCPRSCSACSDALHPPDSCNASSLSGSSESAIMHARKRSHVDRVKLALWRQLNSRGNELILVESWKVHIYEACA